ncbi:hypothetical protein B0H16DRAFT_1887036 [Mycena metata]|uniref:Uncharacterized protein n=1 Tax=Mycena metata TaxID=1033252 RepID=A0AAD7NAR4_9AGAR|nr:hypothetical protein B0H16DRAFT_1887036 [Mycena metata]
MPYYEALAPGSNIGVMEVGTDDEGLQHELGPTGLGKSLLVAPNIADLVWTPKPMRGWWAGDGDVVLHPCLFLFPLFTIRVLVLFHHPPSSLPAPSPHPPKFLDANPPLPFRYPRDTCARRQRHQPQSVLSFYLTHDAHTELLAPYLNSTMGLGRGWWATGGGKRSAQRADRPRPHPKGMCVSLRAAGVLMRLRGWWVGRRREAGMIAAHPEVCLRAAGIRMCLRGVLGDEADHAC